MEAPAHQGSLHRVSLALAHEKIDIELARVGGGEGTRDVFYVRNAAWQQKVMARGLDALTRAMRTLSTSPQVFLNSAEEMRLQG